MSADYFSSDVGRPREDLAMGLMALFADWKSWFQQLLLWADYGGETIFEVHSDEVAERISSASDDLIAYEEAQAIVVALGALQEYGEGNRWTDRRIVERALERALGSSKSLLFDQNVLAELAACCEDISSELEGYREAQKTRLKNEQANQRLELVKALCAVAEVESSGDPLETRPFIRYEGQRIGRMMESPILAAAKEKAARLKLYDGDHLGGKGMIPVYPTLPEDAELEDWIRIVDEDKDEAFGYIKKSDLESAQEAVIVSDAGAVDASENFHWRGYPGSSVTREGHARARCKELEDGTRELSFSNGQELILKPAPDAPGEWVQAFAHDSAFDLHDPDRTLKKEGTNLSLRRDARGSATLGFVRVESLERRILDTHIEGVKCVVRKAPLVTLHSNEKGQVPVGFPAELLGGARDCSELARLVENNDDLILVFPTGLKLPVVTLDQISEGEEVIALVTARVVNSLRMKKDGKSLVVGAGEFDASLNWGPEHEPERRSVLQKNGLVYICDQAVSWVAKPWECTGLAAEQQFVNDLGESRSEPSLCSLGWVPNNTSTWAIPRHQSECHHTQGYARLVREVDGERSPCVDSRGRLLYLDAISIQKLLDAHRGAPDLNLNSTEHSVLLGEYDKENGDWIHLIYAGMNLFDLDKVAAHGMKAAWVRYNPMSDRGLVFPNGYEVKVLHISQVRALGKGHFIPVEVSSDQSREPETFVPREGFEIALKMNFAWAR